MEETLLHEIRDVVTSYRDGEVSADDFYEYLWVKSDELKEKSEELLAQSVDSGYAQRWPELHGLLQLGIENFEGGLEDLIVALEEGCESEFDVCLQRMQLGETEIFRFMANNPDDEDEGPGVTAPLSGGPPPRSDSARKELPDTSGL